MIMTYLPTEMRKVVTITSLLLLQPTMCIFALGSGTKLTQSSCTSSIQLDASDDVKLSEPSIDLSLKCSQGVVFSHPSEQGI